MPARRSPSAKRVSATDLSNRCERLEALLRSVLRSRAQARTELDRARARLRTAGDDFVTAFEAIDARTDSAVAAAELRGLLGHDLDVDTALTVATEHLLARFRPANVAIWLCNGRGDHAVAAYGANDITRRRAEASLALVGRELCPTLGTDPSPHSFDDAAAMVAAPPPGGGVLAGRRAVIASMVHRGERFGAVMLMQSGDSPWQPGAPEAVAALGGVIAEHIDRITRIVVQRTSQWPGEPRGSD